MAVKEVLCICGAEMEFFLDNRIKEMWKCPKENCGRLVLIFHHPEKQGEPLTVKWYQPEKQ